MKNLLLITVVALMAVSCVDGTQKVQVQEPSVFGEAWMTKEGSTWVVTTFDAEFKHNSSTRHIMPGRESGTLGLTIRYYNDDELVAYLYMAYNPSDETTTDMLVEINKAGYPGNKAIEDSKSNQDSSKVEKVDESSTDAKRYLYLNSAKQ